MNNRDLQVIASSGELTALKLNGTTADDAALTKNNRGYKIYTALLNQSGSDAPVATVLENNLGTVTLTRTTQGNYKLNTSALFPSNKTTMFLTTSYADTEVFILYQTSSVINIQTYASGVASDDVLANASLEIKVYD